MTPSEENTLPLSVIELLLVFCFLAFAAAVNVFLAHLNAYPAVYVMVDSALAFFALAIALLYPDSETDHESAYEAIISNLYEQRNNQEYTNHALDELCSVAGRILDANLDGGDRIRAHFPTLQEQHRAYGLLTETEIDPHLLDKDAPAIHPDDKIALLTLLPAKDAGKKRTQKTPASATSATHESSVTVASE